MQSESIALPNASFLYTILHITQARGSESMNIIIISSYSLLPLY